MPTDNNKWIIKLVHADQFELIKKNEKNTDKATCLEKQAQMFSCHDEKYLMLRADRKEITNYFK